MSAPTIEIEKIDPAKATDYLEHNLRNRNLRKRAVELYAEDMREGRWKLNNQAIAFNIAGDLIDGQHRLAAVVESGTPVQMMVMRGLPNETMDVLDTGIRRTTADTIGLMGYSNRAVLASIARLHILYTEQNTDLRAQVSTPRQIAWIDDHAEAANEAAARATSWKQITKPSVLGTAFMLFAEKDHGEAMAFFTAMVEMNMRGVGDPRAALMRRLSGLRADRTRIDQWRELMLFIRTWNAVRAGEKLERVQVDLRPVWREVL